MVSWGTTKRWLEFSRHPHPSTHQEPEWTHKVCSEARTLPTNSCHIHIKGKKQRTQSPWSSSWCPWLDVSGSIAHTRPEGFWHSSHWCSHPQKPGGPQCTALGVVVSYQLPSHLWTSWCNSESPGSCHRNIDSEIEIQVNGFMTLSSTHCLLQQRQVSLHLLQISLVGCAKNLWRRTWHVRIILDLLLGFCSPSWDSHSLLG